ncbi:MAG: VPDSG-CTERM sorting domain-containing protein [Verrucomicrobia bacterium]|nr:VPDSG-CTERM sorting domain-containing protein [Verrucomicrobiota bacterium]
MKSLKIKLLAASAAALLAVNSAFAGAMVAGFNSNSMARNDDDSTGLVSIGFNINFFGTTYNNLYVNNNGNLTFNTPWASWVPFNLYTTGVPIIAPFFSDVDTRATASAVTQYGAGTFAGHNAFGATWNGVGYYSQQSNPLNKFQVLLVDRSDLLDGDFDIYFNYDQILWDHGAATPESALAGFSNGTAEDSYQLAGSGVANAFKDTSLATSLVGHSNVGVNGRYLLLVRNGLVYSNPTLVPDSTSTLGLLSLAFAGLLAFRRRR